MQHFFVPPEAKGQRVDAWLAAALKNLSRSRIKALIEEENLLIAARVVKDPAYRLKGGEQGTLRLPMPKDTALSAYDFPLHIVYEDGDLLVINKPAGLTVHPAPGHPDQTLVNALIAHCGATLSGIGGEKRPGIVHRLDKDTSGLLMVAKHDAAHRALSAQLADRSLSRTYWALVWGAPAQPRGTIRAPLGRSQRNRKKMAILHKAGKDAVTHYQALGRYVPEGKKVSAPLFSLMQCQLETGRTHQIRVHLAHLGHAVVGDPLYGSPTAARLKGKTPPEPLRDALLAFKRQALHAAAIRFIHPVTGEEMAFQCGLPDDMSTLVEWISPKISSEGA